MTKDVKYEIGKNIKRGIIGLKFEVPTTLFVMPARNALEMARQLIEAAKEIAEHKDIQDCLKDIERKVQ